MTNTELKEIENRCNLATKGPWKSMIEGRDHFCGAHFIMTGKEDIYISPFIQSDQDFIANAKQDIPKLIDEIKRLKTIQK